MKKIVMILLIGLFSISYANETYYKNGKLVEFKQKHSTRSNAKQNVGFTNEILLQCKDEVDCLKLLSEFNLTNYSKITDKIFVLKVEDNPFSISRKLFKSKKVEFAHPNFTKERERR